MAGLQELKSMLADNPEAMEIANQVEQTLQTNLNKVQTLEKSVSEWSNKFAEAVESRDKVKEVVKNELGIEEFSPDAVRQKLTSYASEDAIAARDRQFNEFKATASQKLESYQKQVQERDQKLKDMQLKLAISKTDVMGQTKSEHATDLLLQWIAEGAEFDEAGNIVYRGESGETLYNKNGDPMTLEDRIAEIKSDAGRDFIFDSRYLQGGGAPTTAEGAGSGPASSPATGGKLVRTQMSTADKLNYVKKYGQQAYDKLPLV